MSLATAVTHNRRFQRSLALAALLLTACGGTSKTATNRSTTTRTSPTAPAAASLSGELLSVPAVGRIYGQCNPSDPRWTIKFAVTPQTATDRITYRVGYGPPRTVNLNPRDSPLTWTLTPGQSTSHEPADPTTRFPAATIKTTEPLTLDISQGTEPHIYRVKVTLAVAAAIGDTTDCALISSNLSATTYYPGGQPPS